MYCDNKTSVRKLARKTDRQLGTKTYLGYIVENILKKNSVHFDLLGEITEKEIIINDEPTFTVDKVTEFYKGWLYKYMS